MADPPLTASRVSIDGMLRDFAQRLKSVTAIEAAGVALAALGVHFGMPDLMITDVDAAITEPAFAVMFSARSLPDLREFVRGRPLATNPVFKRSWDGDTPFTLSDIRNELKLSESELWELLPPWARGNEAVAVNIRTDRNMVWNFAYSGRAATTNPTVRSVLHVASRMACDRLADLDRDDGKSQRLTQREADVLRLMAAGTSDGEIGKKFGITPRTVRFHVGNAKAKLGVATRAQAVLKTLRGDVT